MRNLNLIIKLQRKIRAFLLSRKKIMNGCHRPNQSSIKLKSLRMSISQENNKNFSMKKYVEDYKFDNASYTGELLNGLRHGRGVQIWEDGAKYDGEWEYDKAHGVGTFYHADGDIYQGQWDNDRANGEGTYINVDGATYQGSWKEDMQDGYGIEVWKDGSSYKGYYKNGQKNGYGEYNWADGSKYEGEWYNNRLNGKVMFIYLGIIFLARWQILYRRFRNELYAW